MDVLETTDQEGNKNQYRKDSTHSDNQIESGALEFLRECLNLAEIQLGDITARNLIPQVRNDLTITAVRLDRDQNIVVIHFFGYGIIHRCHITDIFPNGLPAFQAVCHFGFAVCLKLVDVVLQHSLIKAHDGTDILLSALFCGIQYFLVNLRKGGERNQNCQREAQNCGEKKLFYSLLHPDTPLRPCHVSWQEFPHSS